MVSVHGYVMAWFSAGWVGCGLLYAGEEFAQDFCIFPGAFGAFTESVGGTGLMGSRGAIGHAFMQAGALFEGTESGPESDFGGVALFGVENSGGVGMADAAAETEEAILFEFPEHAAALRATKHGRVAGAIFVRNLWHFLLH